jgi:hypothetical protein
MLALAKAGIQFNIYKDSQTSWWVGELVGWLVGYKKIVPMPKKLLRLQRKRPWYDFD